MPAVNAQAVEGAILDTGFDAAGEVAVFATATTGTLRYSLAQAGIPSTPAARANLLSTSMTANLLAH